MYNFIDFNFQAPQSNGQFDNWYNPPRLVNAFFANSSRNVSSSRPNVLRKVNIHILGVPNGKTYIAKSYPSVDYLQYEVPVYDMIVSGTNERGVTESKTYEVLRFMPYLNRKKDKTRYKTIAEKPFMSGLSRERHQNFVTYNKDYEIHNTFSPENGGFVITGSFMIHDGPDDLINESGRWGSAGCIEVTGTSGFQDLKTYMHKLSGSKESVELTMQKLVNNGLLTLKLDKAITPKIVQK